MSFLISLIGTHNQFILQTNVSTDPASSSLVVPARVVSEGGEGESGGGLSHGGSRGVSLRCLCPDEDLLGAGATKTACFPQTKRET